MHNGIFIDTAWLLSVLIMLCAGVIVGAVITALLYNKRTNSMWAEINRIKYGYPNAAQVSVPVITEYHRPEPMLSDETEISVLGDTRREFNSQYSPAEAGLDILAGQYREAGFPGTEPIPAVSDVTTWDTYYRPVDSDDTVVAAPPRSEVDIWGGGRSITDVLDDIERSSWTGTRTGSGVR